MATDPKTIAAYNDHAESYDKHVSDPTDSTFHSYYEKPAIRAELPKLDGLDVISIGCGSGVDARWLADNGAKRVVGMDIASGLIDIAKKNHPGIEFRVMDMDSLDFEDESFGLAYSSLALHYVDDWVKPLQEAWRILKPGGQYIFSCGHPIDSAMEYFKDDESRGARLGRTIMQVTGRRIVHGDYLAAAGNGINPIDGNLGELEIRIYHRPISKMFEQIQSSGFSVERLVEPQPTDEMKAADPDMFEQLTRIPSFMIWVLKK